MLHAESIPIISDPLIYAPGITMRASLAINQTIANKSIKVNCHRNAIKVNCHRNYTVIKIWA